LRPVYRLYIDESGDHTYGRIEESPFFIKHGYKKEIIGTIDSYPQLEKDDKRFLGLTGCIFNLNYYRNEFIQTIESFKRDFFDPDEQVILHAKEVMQRKGAFHILQNEEIAHRFDAGIIDLVANAEYTVINVVIDKKNHIENYGALAWHPYHYCLTVMLERYCYFLKTLRVKGDVMAESRGTTEDFELKNAYVRLYMDGTRFKSNTFFQQYLTSKEIKIKPKSKNVAGLQLADVLTHPLKKYTLLREKLIPPPEEDVFWLKIVDTIKQKIYCRASDGKVDGYGIVFIK